MESIKRNMAHLVRIGAIVEQRWNLREDLWSNEKESEKESEDNEKRFKNGPRESQEEVEKRTPSLVFC